MTGALLHRFCPDHSPERSLCGLDVAGIPELTEAQVAADPRPPCVVCEDLHRLACEDVCLALREATR